MQSTGMDATGEFDWLAEQIVTHDDLVKNIQTNIHFFGNPTLVSSRPKQDLMETGDDDGFRPTISSQAGFYAANRPSTRVSSPMSGMGGGGMKVPRIIANIESTPTEPSTSRQMLFRATRTCTHVNTEKRFERPWAVSMSWYYCRCNCVRNQEPLWRVAATSATRRCCVVFGPTAFASCCG